MFDEDEPPADLIDVVNIPKNIYYVISNGKATYIELQCDLNAEDLLNLLELITVDNFNQRLTQRTIVAKAKAKTRRANGS